MREAAILNCKEDEIILVQGMPGEICKGHVRKSALHRNHGQADEYLVVSLSFLKRFAE